MSPRYIGLIILPPDSFMSKLYSQLWLVFSAVVGFATDCPCGVSCRGLTICLLYITPLFKHSFNQQLICKCDIAVNGFTFFSVIKTYILAYLNLS